MTNIIYGTCTRFITAIFPIANHKKLLWIVFLKYYNTNNYIDIKYIYNKQVLMKFLFQELQFETPQLEIIQFKNHMKCDPTWLIF